MKFGKVEVLLRLLKNLVTLYNYATNTKKLTSVVHDNSGTPQNHAQYTYDEIDQLMYENTLNAANKKYIQYDVTGKVVLEARDAAFTQKLVEYVYDEVGQRLIKRNCNSSYQHIQNTYYISGVVYTQPVSGGGGVGRTITAQEYDIDGGMGRIGIFYRPTSIYTYEMTDHLGNVRAVVARMPAIFKSERIQTTTLMVWLSRACQILIATATRASRLFFPISMTIFPISYNEGFTLFYFCAVNSKPLT